MKAQASMEFLVLASIGFLMFVLFALYAVDSIRGYTDVREFDLLKDAASKLQKETMIAAAVEDGYSRSFTMPDKLHATIDYFIITKNGTITVNSSITVHTVATPVVQGNFTKGLNRIRKTNGTIFVNQ